MNKILKERHLNPFVQAHGRSPMEFMEFLNFVEVKQSFIRSGKEVGQLCANVKYA